MEGRGRFTRADDQMIDIYLFKSTLLSIPDLQEKDVEDASSSLSL
jgi:hypothetical protein